MANVHDVYNDIGKLTQLSEKVSEENYSPAADLGEQAERLEQIAVLAAENAVLLRGLDEVLS